MLFRSVAKIGYGLNSNEFIGKYLDVNDSSDVKIDHMLAAGNWNLFDQSGLKDMVRCEQNDIEVHLASVFAGGYVFRQKDVPYRYGIEDDKAAEKEKMWTAWNELCEKYDVTMAAVAIKFAALPKVVTKIILGMKSKAEVDLIFECMEEGEKVPMDIFHDAQKAGLIRPEVQLPPL